MKCTICFKEFQPEEPVFLATDTKDTSIYCEEHKPENSFESTLKLAALTIGRRLGGGSVKEEPIKKDTKNVKEEVIEGEATVVEKEEILINVEDIKFEVIKQVKPDIDFKYMFVKDQLKKALKKYVGLIVTEENLKSVKEDKKSLAALKAKINRFRIDEKKILLVPITEMEQNLKNLEAEIDSVLDPIKEGIKVYDDKKKQVNYEKRLEWLEKAYESNKLREEFQTIVVAHNTKKADIDAAVEAKLLVQLEKDNTDKANEQARQNDINWIKTSVKQQEDALGIKLDEQKYLNKYELNVPIQSIMSDIVSDAQTNAKNAAAAVAEKEEVIEEVVVDVTEKVFDREAFNEFSEKLENGDSYNPKTGEIKEIPKPNKYRFVIEITETIENLQLLKDFLDGQDLDYDQVGEVEKIEEES